MDDRPKVKTAVLEELKPRIVVTSFTSRDRIVVYVIAVTIILNFVFVLLRIPWHEIWQTVRG